MNLHPWGRVAAGSNPVTPTKEILQKRLSYPGEPFLMNDLPVP